MGVIKKNQNTPSCIDVDVILGNCTKLFVMKDQPPPTSNKPSGHKTFRWDQGL